MAFIAPTFYNGRWAQLDATDQGVDGVAYIQAIYISSGFWQAGTLRLEDADGNPIWSCPQLNNEAQFIKFHPPLALHNGWKAALANEVHFEMFVYFV
jgi:hypothetical protein